MKKRLFLTGLTALTLAIGLMMAGCEGPVGAGGPAGAPFAVTTNDATLNDAETLGFTGTGVSSSNEAVATAEIVDEKIAITSKRTGDAVITVHYGPFTSTIPVSVGNLGAIELGAITKEVVRDITPDNNLRTDYSLVATYTTRGITVTKVEATGTAGYSGHKVLITLGGTIPNANRGKSGNTLLSDASLYGNSRYAGADASLNTEFARIGIRNIGDVAPPYDSSNTFKEALI